MNEEVYYCQYCGYRFKARTTLLCPKCSAEPEAVLLWNKERNEDIFLASERDRGGAYHPQIDRIWICRGALGRGIEKVLNHEYFHKILSNLELYDTETIMNYPNPTHLWDDFLWYLRENDKDEILDILFELTEEDIESNFRDWSKTELDALKRFDYEQIISK